MIKVTEEEILELKIRFYNELYQGIIGDGISFKDYVSLKTDWKRQVPLTVSDSRFKKLPQYFKNK